MFGKKGNAMLYSGLHFKGNWESAFNRQNTKQREFYISDKKNVSTPMMNLKLDLSVSKNYKQKGFNLIELPLEVQQTTHETSTLCYKMAKIYFFFSRIPDSNC